VFFFFKKVFQKCKKSSKKLIKKRGLFWSILELAGFRAKNAQKFKKWSKNLILHEGQKKAKNRSTSHSYGLFLRKMFPVTFFTPSPPPVAPFLMLQNVS
jgi:hypothetical protein